MLIITIPVVIDCYQEQPHLLDPHLGKSQLYGAEILRYDVLLFMQ
jgi:hypothetical protein